LDEGVRPQSTGAPSAAFVKRLSLAALLQAAKRLGMDLERVGDKTLENVGRHYRTLDGLLDAIRARTSETLPGIKAGTLDRIANGLRQDDWEHRLSSAWEQVLILNQAAPAQETRQPLEGQTWVLTGTLSKLTRD